MSQDRVDEELARNGGLSYIHIPATDPSASADFYERVFGWTIYRPSPRRVSFQDGTRHVAGAFVTDQAVSREPGFLPYIYVDDLDGTIAKVEAEGCEVVAPGGPQGNLRIATVRDPAGNAIGLWQEAG